MAHTGLKVASAARRRDVGAEVVRHDGLAGGADLVAFGLDRHEAGIANGGQVDPTAVDHHLTAGELVVLEHPTNRVEIELRWEVGHGEVLVVERPGCRRAVVLAASEVAPELHVRTNVAVHVHAHERADLQESGVHPPSRSGEPAWHGGERARLEPFDGLCHGDVVDPGRIDPGVDWTGHEGQRAGLCGAVGLGQERSSCQRGHHGLAHGDEVSALAQLFDEPHEVADRVVESERTGAERNVSGVVPIGDVDVEVAQERLHGLAQQGGEVP